SDGPGPGVDPLNRLTSAGVANPSVSTPESVSKSSGCTAVTASQAARLSFSMRLSTAGHAARMVSQVTGPAGADSAGSAWDWLSCEAASLSCEATDALASVDGVTTWA